MLLFNWFILRELQWFHSFFYLSIILFFSIKYLNCILLRCVTQHITLEYVMLLCVLRVRCVVNVYLRCVVLLCIIQRSLTLLCVLAVRCCVPVFTYTQSCCVTLSASRCCVTVWSHICLSESIHRPVVYHWSASVTNRPHSKVHVTHHRPSGPLVYLCNKQTTK